MHCFCIFQSLLHLALVCSWIVLHLFGNLLTRLLCSTLVSKSFLHMHLKPLHFIFFLWINPSIPICTFSCVHFVKKIVSRHYHRYWMFVYRFVLQCVLHAFIKIMIETLELYVTEDSESKSIYLAEGYCTSKTRSVTDLLFLGVRWNRQGFQ